jgi:uncharacterized membrane protein
MDLMQATGNGGLPINTFNISGAEAVKAPKTDHDYTRLAHLVLSLGAFVILFPMGYLLLRYFNSVKYHWWMQSFAILIAFVGMGEGISESLLFNKVLM